VEYIRRGWGVFFFVRNEVGDGSKIKFSHDLWCADQLLKETFPDLFSIACCKDTWVADDMQLLNRNLQWNISFTKPMHDWEVDLVSSFFELLNYIRLRQGSEDKICWIPSKRQKFEVMSFYNVLLIPTSSPFP
jgi:hypothetical protein